MSLKIPVAAWQDAEGSFTATTLDGPRAAVVDVTLAAAPRSAQEIPDLGIAER